MAVSDRNGAPSLGARLKGLREERGLSQEDVAARLYVTRQAVSSWERDRTEPGVAALRELAGLYGVTVDELVRGVEAERPCETLKTAALVFLLIGLALIPLSLPAGPGMVIHAGVFCGFANVVVWFALSGAIRTGDPSILSGFDGRADYHLPTLRRMLDAIRFWVILSDTALCLVCPLAALLPGEPPMFAFVLFLAVYLFDLFAGLEVISRRYQDALYLRREDRWRVRVSALPVWLFCGQLCLALAANAAAVDLFGVENNSPGALVLAGLTILHCVVNLAALGGGLWRAGKLAKAGARYRPNTLELAGNVLCLLLSGVILWSSLPA